MNNHISFTLRSPAFSLCLILLVACGGGDGNAPSSSASSSSSSSGGVAATVNTVVTIDSSVPTSIKSEVTQVTSTADAQAPGATLAIPSTSSGLDAAVLAVDS